MVNLAIDIGQTQARVRIAARTRPGDVVELAGFTYGSDLLTGIADVVDNAVEKLRVDRVDAVAVGSTGLYGHVPPIDDLASRLRDRHGTRRVIVADDAVTAYLGALGDAHGVVVAAGTGIVGLGHGPHGTARVDGVGGMIGDEGSGWWIGRQGLIAAVSAADGRPRASPALLERLHTRFGPVAAFPAFLAAESSPVAVVASFARDVADIARAGDVIALSIWRQAGEHIAGVIAAAATRAGLEPPARWSLIGRLGGAIDLLHDGLQPCLDTLFPGNSFLTTHGEPLDGVRRLLTIDPANYAPMVRESRLS